MTEIRSPDERHECLHSPLWIEAFRGDELEWQNARDYTAGPPQRTSRPDAFPIRRPVIIVLPGGFRRQLREIAPDLWSVRNHSIDLDEIRSLHTDGGVETAAGPDREEPPPHLGNAVALLAEWDRIVARAATGRDVLMAGGRAIDAALSLAKMEQAHPLPKRC